MNSTEHNLTNKYKSFQITIFLSDRLVTQAHGLRPVIGFAANRHSFIIAEDSTGSSHDCKRDILEQINVC